eukprot:GHVT01078790.1.p1 GENE.GHVT01078790.1~~GHVT01078790.1.p1  ORF type:complete len:486 (+),score=38.19 GHVT01078790.1:393-1850(+)
MGIDVSLFVFFSFCCSLAGRAQLLNTSVVDLPAEPLVALPAAVTSAATPASLLAPRGGAACFAVLSALAAQRRRSEDLIRVPTTGSHNLGHSATAFTVPASSSAASSMSLTSSSGGESTHILAPPSAPTSVQGGATISQAFRPAWLRRTVAGGGRLDNAYATRFLSQRRALGGTSRLLGQVAQRRHQVHCHLAQLMEQSAHGVRSVTAATAASGPSVGSPTITVGRVVRGESGTASSFKANTTGGSSEDPYRGSEHSRTGSTRNKLDASGSTPGIHYARIKGPIDRSKEPFSQGYSQLERTPKVPVHDTITSGSRADEDATPALQGSDVRASSKLHNADTATPGAVGGLMSQESDSSLLPAAHTHVVNNTRNTIEDTETDRLGADSLAGEGRRNPMPQSSISAGFRGANASRPGSQRRRREAGERAAPLRKKTPRGSPSDEGKLSATPSSYSTPAQSHASAYPAGELPTVSENVEEDAIDIPMAE